MLIVGINCSGYVTSAVVHADGTRRLQAVLYDENLLYHKLALGFKQKRGTSIVLSTSFSSGLDLLDIGSYLIQKIKQEFNKI